MRLKEFLRADFVVPQLTAHDVEGVVAEVSACAGAAGVGPEDLIRSKLLERERVHPTVMGSGLAIPHATVPGLSAPVIGVALSREAIPFGGETFEPARLFFVLLSPPGYEREHVKLLARICRLVRHQGIIDELERAGDAAQVIDIIEAVDAEHA
ncbi:MAG: PTS sugar transporter subunit IIA [Gemmatimonadetes bacterium]|nr:PTS sugar transporter subunit IIA [Gemmatimonadota bacterium]